MLTSADLTAMRAVQALTFDRQAVITRGGGSTSDGAGGTITGSPVTVATVACRLAPNQTADREAIAAAGLQAQTVWRLTVPQGTDLRTSDRVTVGSQGYEVLAVYGPRSYETARVALCVYVPGGAMSPIVATGNQLDFSWAINSGHVGSA